MNKQEWVIGLAGHEGKHIIEIPKARYRSYSNYLLKDWEDPSHKAVSSVLQDRIYELKASD